MGRRGGPGRTVRLGDTYRLWEDGTLAKFVEIPPVEMIPHRMTCGAMSGAISCSELSGSWVEDPTSVRTAIFLHGYEQWLGGNKLRKAGFPTVTFCLNPFGVWVRSSGYPDVCRQSRIFLQVRGSSVRN